MKIDKYHIILFVTIILNLLLVENTIKEIEYNNDVYSKEIKQYYESIYERRIMGEYDPDIQMKLFEGIYFTPEYYCVWTKGKNETEIYNTDTHELCHNLIYNDYEHFCIDSPRK